MQVNFYATLRAVVGQKTVDLPLPLGSSALDLARQVADRWPELSEQILDAKGDVSRQVQLLIGGRNIQWLPEGSGTKIQPEDVIDIFPPTAGG